MSAATVDQATRQVVLACEDVQLSFGGVKALDKVTFELEAGQVVGLIGPNGAGKTSLLNCLTGFYRPSAGTITVAEVTVNTLSTAAITALGVARTFQQAESLSGMGALDVMLLGRERFLPRGVLRYAFPTPSIRRAEREAKEVVMTIGEELGITEFVARNMPYENLPYGVRKLIDLGRAVACEPTLLVMDEPAAGLSAIEKGRMIEAIRRIQSERGLTQLLVDHDIDFVSAVSSRLVVLDAGTLIANGPVADVLANPAVIDSYIGRADTDDAPEEADA
jgi:branched-chain amino acid transport system ATP-binding protein